MKRTRIAAGLALAALVSTVGTPAFAAQTTQSTVTQSQVPPINEAALKQSIAGLPAPDATAAEVRVGGSKGSWHGVTGVTDLRTERSAKEGARFRAGSVTKIFTVAVVLQLVAEGRISLDDTVQKYLPGLLPDDYPAIKVAQLLNHTSGLPSPTFGDGFEWVYATRFKKWTPEEYVGKAVENPIEFTPGSRQHYLNTNTFVAGLLIEKITGRSYEHEVTTRILKPVGMRDSYLPGDSIRIRGRHNKGYQVVPKGFQNAIKYGEQYVVDMTETSVTSTWASGDLVSTTADLEKFIIALFRGEVVPAAQLEPMFTVPQVTMYGGDQPAVYTSGLTRLELPGGIVAFGKTGARYGSAAGVGATRDLSRTVAYSINSTDAKASGQNQRGLGVALAAFAK
ncbi:beta-lactamase family protein [Microtetraspora sp. AC03309]|uniref:serine hydrolase domain-containing protein n=1 Tax=Microtetraspora sp. AC03309 TaxID=2779376 RepID=UPI001E61CFED|nr:serine hydrolase domain-containing protein [Microtetraspora sp. AC03309]MCC5577242.1 beta-lactamase family protein [Microtetraspora sp. AC03309]